MVNIKKRRSPNYLIFFFILHNRKLQISFIWFLYLTLNLRIQNSKLNPLLECSSPPSFLNADLVIEPNTQIVFGIGSLKSYQLKEGYLSSSNNHDFQMACHDDGIWIGYQSGVFKSCTFIYFSEGKGGAFENYINHLLIIFYGCKLVNLLIVWNNQCKIT